MCDTEVVENEMKPTDAAPAETVPESTRDQISEKVTDTETAAPVPAPEAMGVDVSILEADNEDPSFRLLLELMMNC
jgi:hypothetical protein